MSFSGKSILLLILLLIACGSWLFLALSPGPEDARIRSAIISTAELLTKQQGTKPLAGLEDAGELRKYLAPDLSITLPTYHIRKTLSRKEALQRYFLFRKNLPEILIRADVGDISINAEQPDTAEAKAVVRIDYPKGGRQYTESLDVLIGMKKLSGDWTMMSVSVPEKEPEN